jgi:type I restriction enzyme R subunit
VDEAHSSQTREAAKDLKTALGAASAEAQLEAAEDAEAADVPLDPQDALATTVAARGRQPNLSFVAFTATPKARTLELFGQARELRASPLRHMKSDLAVRRQP